MQSQNPRLSLIDAIRAPSMCNCACVFECMSLAATGQE